MDLKKNTNSGVWYRIEESVSYGFTDEFDSFTPFYIPRVELVMREFPVIRKTPKGVWLDVFGVEKFILKDAKKRWACPTKKEAIKSFKARKIRQSKILRKQLRIAEMALNLIEDKLDFLIYEGS